MADQPLAEMVEIAVREFVTDPDGIQESSHPSGRDDSNHTGKRRRVEVTQLELEEGEDSIQALLYSASKTLCLRLDAIEADLNSMEDKCKCLRAKVDMLANQNALRPPVTEQSTGIQQGGSSCPSANPAVSGRSLAPAVCGRRPRELPSPDEDGPGIRPRVQGVGPRVRIVAMRTDGRAEGEERHEGTPGVALLSDATNLLYQLMY